MRTPIPGDPPPLPSFMTGARYLAGVALASVILVTSLLLATEGRTGLQQQDPAAPRTQTIDINPRAARRPFPHFWERMFGSGRAILTLRDGYRRDLRTVKSITDFEYVRFHAVFHDEVGLYETDASGSPQYKFSYVDQIYDGLLESGVRPFVELSFMPQKLAARPLFHPFWYKPVVSPPRQWSEWNELVGRFTGHLVDRYGLAEVSRWYFEVWNEPNIDFWAGEPKQETYYRLYDGAARAIKTVGHTLRVGGPATAQAAWIPAFIQHTVDGQVPVDFVSTHVYANDSAQDVFGTKETISRLDMVGRAVRTVHQQVKSSARPDLPIIWSEYNASYKNEPPVTDAPFMGPWLADTIRQTDGFVDVLAYWTLSDVFEEQGVVKQPFYGGYGLLAAGGVPKPAFNAFKLLHKLGTERLQAETPSALVTRHDDGGLTIAVWNLALPEETGSPVRMTLKVRGMSHRQARLSRVDAAHGSPLVAYERMGRPPFPTRDQILMLQQVAELPDPERLWLTAGGLTITVPPHGLALLEIR